MVTGVNSMISSSGSGSGGNTVTMTSSGSPPTLGATANGTNSSDPHQMNGISIIEPAKRTGDNRRSNKPIMEKRRRARINNCLNELKALILDATKKDPRHSKFEKADILEKTVKHLQDLQRQQLILSQAADPNVINKFKAGFTECAAEVGRFGGVDPVVKRRLLQHLSNCLTGVKTTEGNGPVHILPSPPSSPDHQMDKMGGRHPAAVPAQNTSSAAAAAATGQQPGGQSFNHITLSSSGYFLTNGNGGVGVQLIPTKLTNGNIAFVVPPNGLQFQTPAQAAAAASVAAAAAVHQPQSNTPLPMLIPIPSRQQQQQQAAQQQVGSNSASPSSSESLLAAENNNSASSHSLARSTSTSPQHHHQHLHHHYPMQHVTSSSSSYDRRTPSSSYGSMDSQTMSPPNSPQSSGVCQGPPYKRARSSIETCDSEMNEERSECHSPGPLSLVVRKRSRDSSDEGEDSDKQCWRPW